RDGGPLGQHQGTHVPRPGEPPAGDGVVGPGGQLGVDALVVPVDVQGDEAVLAQEGHVEGDHPAHVVEHLAVGRTELDTGGLLAGAQVDVAEVAAARPRGVAKPYEDVGGAGAV